LLRGWQRSPKPSIVIDPITTRAISPEGDTEMSDTAAHEVVEIVTAYEAGLYDSAWNAYWSEIHQTSSEVYGDDGNIEATNDAATIVAGLIDGETVATPREISIAFNVLGIRIQDLQRESLCPQCGGSFESHHPACDEMD
jgi:hypothetical protein